METDSTDTITQRHVAGIIPVAGQPLDFKFDWSDCLMPIAPDYTAIERSVVECAYAGCQTIWIICNDDVSPLIRHRLGEYIQDPVYCNRRLDQFPSESRKAIPIFYSPVHPRDRDKRDCLGWSVLHGALTAFKVSNGLSRWVAPHRYYVSFPYGVYAPEFVRGYRKEISSASSFYLRCDGRTVRDGEYLGFTFDSDGAKKFRNNVREKSTGIYMPTADSTTHSIEKLPVEKRYSARHFSLDTVFNCGIIEEDRVIDIPWYYNIGSWDKYCEFIGSNERNTFTRPNKKLLSYGEWNQIGQDEE